MNSNHRKIVISVCCCLGLCVQASPWFGLGSPEKSNNTINSLFVLDDVKSRIEAMDCLVKPELVDDVFDQVKRFVVSDRNSSKLILYRRELYYPIMDKLLAENNLPKELKYLATLESRLNPSAMSHVGAGGLWQFMPATARMKGLRVNPNIDERLDAVLSTYAAIKHLKTLYGIFEDWALVLAAYNCGEYKVMDVIKKTKSKDFWKIRKHLPRQTQLFVPAFIGVSYLMQYYEEHGLVPALEDLPSQTLTYVKIYEKFPIKPMLKATGINAALFEEFNPAYKKGSIDCDKKGQFVALPDSHMVHFVEYYMAKYNKIEGTENQELERLQGGNALILDIFTFSRPNIEHPEKIENTVIKSFTHNLMDLNMPKNPRIEVTISSNYTYHLIRSRESLSDIASQYSNVSIDELMEWNSIEDDKDVAAGNVLVIKK
ncbi:MAG: transglycosylase SLT domain-containing protein [Bacteroidota bacterium]|nr:transglycosylase SLT domain-containing protein [Bacteroidota bacterium]